MSGNPRSYPLNAFKPDIFAPFNPNYYIPYVNIIHDILYHRERVRPKLYQMTDSFMMFYKPFYEARKNLVEPPVTLWHKIIHRFVSSEEYVRLNNVTAGSADLAIVAAVSWWKAFARLSGLRRKSEFEALSYGDAIEAAGNCKDPADRLRIAALARSGCYKEDDLVKAARDAAARALGAVLEYAGARDEAAGAAAILCGSGGDTFSHEALSVWHYLENPDEFRRKVRVLKECARWLQSFTRMVPSSLEKAMIAAAFGGASGVGVLQDYRQIVDLHPTELANPTPLRIMRILTKRAAVVERAASIEPVVFVDKSGSMAESWCGTPKISAAAGLALALHRKLHADVYLFDTEVDRVSPRDVVDTLLRIQADGGTRIARVLEEVERLPPSRPVIVITDGIDEVDVEYARRVASRRRVLFVLIPPCWESTWLQPFKRVRPRSPEEMFRSVVGFLG